jgi:hypothetical protein
MPQRTALGKTGVSVHTRSLHAAPGAAQMPQLSLQQTCPTLQVFLPHITLDDAASAAAIDGTTGAPAEPPRPACPAVPAAPPPPSVPAAAPLPAMPPIPPVPLIPPPPPIPTTPPAPALAGTAFGESAGGELVAVGDVPCTAAGTEIDEVPPVEVVAAWSERRSATAGLKRVRTPTVRPNPTSDSVRSATHEAAANAIIARDRFDQRRGGRALGVLMPSGAARGIPSRERYLSRVAPYVTAVCIGFWVP